MITRDPLLVPCLNGEYWNTLPAVSAPRFAAILALAKSRHPPLATITGIPHAAQLRAEADNISACIRHARTHWPAAARSS